MSAFPCKTLLMRDQWNASLPCPSALSSYFRHLLAKQLNNIFRCQKSLHSDLLEFPMTVKIGAIALVIRAAALGCPTNRSRGAGCPTRPPCGPSPNTSRQHIGRVLIGFSRAYYIGVSRTTFSTLASSTVTFDKCSSAATWAFVIWASCFCIRSRTSRAPDSRATSSSRSYFAMSSRWLTMRHCCSSMCFLARSTSCLALTAGFS